MDARIRTAGEDVVENQPEEEKKVRAVTMEFRVAEVIVVVAGWHLTADQRVPFLISLSTTFYKDSFPQFNRVDFP